MRRTSIDRGIIIPDTHFPLHDEAALKCTLKAIGILRPNFCVNIGDIGEFEYVSHWQWKKKKRPPLEYQLPKVDAELILINGGLDRIDEALDKVKCKDKHLTVGNHDNWLDLFVEENPILPQYSLNNALRLKERGYKVHPFGKYYKRGHLHFYHGHHYSGVSHTRAHLLATGANLIYGHWHDIQVYSIKHVDGRKAAWSIGCLKRLDDEANLWNMRRKHNWGHSLTFVDYFPNGDFVVSCTEITNGKTILWGKVLDGNSKK